LDGIVQVNEENAENLCHARELQIVGVQACVLSNARQHLGADFNAVVKGPNVFASRGMR